MMLLKCVYHYFDLLQRTTQRANTSFGKVLQAGIAGLRRQYHPVSAVHEPYRKPSAVDFSQCGAFQPFPLCIF
jgi:hypothetical protein